MKLITEHKPATDKFGFGTWLSHLIEKQSLLKAYGVDSWITFYTADSGVSVYALIANQ